MSFAISLIGTQKALIAQGIKKDFVFCSNCAIISKARSLLIGDFLTTDGTDFMFLDSDIGFPPNKLLEILNRPEEIVAGLYPSKVEGSQEFSVELDTDENGHVIPSKDGILLKANRLPTGFMRIKRSAIEKMIKAYPELRWTEQRKGQSFELYDLFGHTGRDGVWAGEDFAFCDRWKAIGGELWAYPNIDFTHTGESQWTGNYGKALIKNQREENDS